MVEEWRIVSEFPNYMVSNLGNVKSVERFCLKRKRRGMPLKPALNHKGYHTVKLYKIRDGKLTSNTRFIHRLVAIAFINNANKKPEVNHINGIKTDNRVDNLEWMTTSENIQHAFDTGIKPKPTGEAHPSAKLTNKIASEIREKYQKGIITYTDLAKQYGVNHDTIGLIIRNRIYV